MTKDMIGIGKVFCCWMTNMELALSLTSQYKANKALLSKPISTLAKMKGLCAEQVYDKLIPELAKKDIGEVMRYAETGLRYATIVDRNRLRDEIGMKFIVAMDMICNIVVDGLDNEEPWIKRKAMAMHGELIDEQAEKQRFVDVIITEQKLEMLKQSEKNLSQLEQEIWEFEEKAILPDEPAQQTRKKIEFYPLMVI